MNRALTALVLALCIAWTGSAGPAHAAEGDEFGALTWIDPDLPDDADTWLQGLVEGSPLLDMRLRYERADFDGLIPSDAVTLRTRLGYRTKPWMGWSLEGDFENVVSPNPDDYDAVPPPDGQAVIGDPQATEVNRAFVRYQNPKLWIDRAVGGRQRIVLDDARFVGNVIWRQNEQTYDSASLTTPLGVDDLSVFYSYVWGVHRVFGEGPMANFDSDSHFVNAAYEGLGPLRLVGFAYLLDLKDAPMFSSNTYGLRATARHDFADDWSARGAFSYARQSDAGGNPTPYAANYYLVEADVEYAPLLGGTLGFELLGSDDGRAQFVTPLATLHKFNGWADVFLDNGGPAGLRDLYVGLSPTLPWDFQGRLVYHEYWRDDTGGSFGREIDGDLTRPFLKHFLARLKFAVYRGGDGPRADGYRFWTELTFTL